MKRATIILYLVYINVLVAQCQSLTMPRTSPISYVSQRIGITDIQITYSSPFVRNREIWGGLVPMNKVWRAGADNNSIFETSHEIAINNHLLPAGKYGLHMIPAEEEWVIIFSKNNNSWGSFSYDESEDQLRIKVKPTAVEFQEYLSYQFEDRSENQVIASMIWEKIRIAFTIDLEVEKIVVNNFKKELRSKSQFDWQAWHQAAQYCLYQNVELEQGLEWVDYSLDGFFGSKEVFENLKTKAGLLEKLDSTSAALEIMERALNHPTATALNLYRHGRQILNNKMPEKALEIFQLCQNRFPENWLSHHGLARGFSSLSLFEKALLHEEKALEMAPEKSKVFLKENILKLKKKEDFN